MSQKRPSKPTQMNNNLTIDRFINATRLNMESRVNLSIYEENISKLTRMADYFNLPTNFKIVYSAARRVELITLSGKTWIVYDQYMGQTMNLLNRLFIEAETGRPSITYFHKVLAERLVEVGRFEDALHCASIYSTHRKDLESKGLNEDWRWFLTNVHESFLLYHEFGHRIFVNETILPEVREHACELIADVIELKQRPIEEILEAIRIAPSAAILNQNIDEVITHIQTQDKSDLQFNDAQIAYLNDPQTFEEVFCDLIAADLTLGDIKNKGQDSIKVLRAIYIGFYHMQALEYLRRFPSLPDGPADWTMDTIPKVQARGHCLRKHLIFLYKKTLVSEQDANIENLKEKVSAFEILLMEDQRRHYDVIYDSAMHLCDGLRKDSWVTELGKEAMKRLDDERNFQNKEKLSMSNDKLRTIILILTGWLP